jgi:hypothetical protein
MEKLTPDQKIKQVLAKLDRPVSKPWQAKRSEKIRNRERSGRISS